MENFLFYYLRRFYFKFRRRWYKMKSIFDRFKWCLIGGFAYAAGRFAFHYLQSLF